MSKALSEEEKREKILHREEKQKNGSDVIKSTSDDYFYGVFQNTMPMVSVTLIFKKVLLIFF